MPDGISPFDIALGLPLLWAAIRGLRKGFVMEVTGLVALFLGAYAALFCSDLAAAWLDERFAIGHEYLGITSFAATFIAVVLGVHLLGRVVEKMVDLTALKPLDLFPLRSVPVGEITTPHFVLQQTQAHSAP